ncbi:RecT family recombinase [Acidihalobacter prosperus]|nr:RecT family recombinase [Acidihalobacter prosperus]
MNAAPAKNQPPAWRLMIAQTEAAYTDIVRGAGTGLSYSAEQVFAVQACMTNDFLADTASRNPQSLRLAMLNSAAVGLTLNPAEKLAYLVPRDGRVVLDISYRGLIKIAVDIGSIQWAKAELVYKNDQFKSLGPGQLPEHVFDPFEDDRGEFIGAYCVAKLADGSWLTEIMRASEIWKTRDMSQAWVKKKKGPWADWPDEMIKKTVIKRASKTWPASGGRLAKAIHLLNEQGEGLAPEHLALNALESPEEGDPEKAGEKARNTVTRALNQAAENGMWAAAEQYFRDRFKNPDELAYALRELENRKQALPAEAGSSDESGDDPA